MSSGEYCKLIANCKLQISLACVFALAATSAAAQPFSFDDIEYWVGNGSNRAALVVDWLEGSTELPALAWGYRWEGAAMGRDMLLDIVAADDRLFVKLGDNPENPIRVFGIGYDADNDGQFGVEGTSFNSDGIAFGSAPFFPAAKTDADDLYAEGWTFAFWHYGVASTNPYDGGAWDDVQFGMASRELSDGAWDSWAFEEPADPPFEAYAENPQPAPPPFPSGDYDRDGSVTASDYERWKTLYGTTDPAADGNGDGVVGAADYTVWRNHMIASSAASAAQPLDVPEPPSCMLAMAIVIVSAAAQRRHRSRVAAARLLHKERKIPS
jgi:hypothetical protein